MPQKNVKLVYQANDAFNRRDIDALLALSDPDGEFSPRSLQMEGGRPYRGHNEIRSWFEDLFSLSPDLSGKIEQVREFGDVTIVRTRLRGHGGASDVLVEQTQWTVTEWRQGKGIRTRVFGSEAEALEAAGLSV